MSATGETSIIYNDVSISNPAINIARIHPLVIFKIADHYLRRGKAENPETDNYCIGLLLGEIVNNDAIVRDIVPLSRKQENEEELVSVSYNQHHILFPNEKILGWYAFSDHMVEFPSIIAEGSNGIHIWMKPYVPPKIDVFAVNKSRELKLVSLPIQYRIEANIPEQLTLSRIADASSTGSLQAAINELIGLLKNTKERLNRGECSKETCRKIHSALSQAVLNSSSIKTLDDSLRNIENFSQILKETENSITKVEDILSIQYK